MLRELPKRGLAQQQLHTPPYTLHPTPYTTPYTLNPTPYTPCTLHPTPYTLHATSCTLLATPNPMAPRQHTLRRWKSTRREILWGASGMIVRGRAVVSAWKTPGWKRHGGADSGDTHCGTKCMQRTHSSAGRTLLELLLLFSHVLLLVPSALLQAWRGDGWGKSISSA